MVLALLFFSNYFFPLFLFSLPPCFIKIHTYMFVCVCNVRTYTCVYMYLYYTRLPVVALLTARTFQI